MNEKEKQLFDAAIYNCNMWINFCEQFYNNPKIMSVYNKYRQECNSNGIGDAADIIICMITDLVK